MSKLYLLYKEWRIPIILHAILVLLAHFLWALLLFLFLPFVFSFQLVKFITHLLARYIDKCQPVCLHEIPFILHYDNEPYWIVTLMKINGKLRVEEFCELFRTRILEREPDLVVRKLKQYLTSSFYTYVWKSVEDFKLEDQIVSYDHLLAGTKDELKTIFLNLTQERLPPSRPLWKVLVCNTSDGAHTYLFFSFHHILGDGFSLQIFGMNIFDKKPIAPLLQQSADVLRNPFQRIIYGLITWPLVLTTVAFSRTYDHPFRPKTFQDGRCVAWARSSFDLVKKIKNRTGTTVNDVFLAALSGAFTKYLGNRMIPNLPIFISFNARSYQDRLKKNNPLENNSGGTFLSLPVGKLPIETLNTIHKRTQILKNSSDGHIFHFIFGSVFGLLPNFLGRLCTHTLQQHCCTLFSNVPGPSEVLTLNGLEVDSIIPTPPLMCGLGISVALFTYNTDVFIGILSHKSVLPDPERLVSLFVEEISELHSTFKVKTN